MKILNKILTVLMVLLSALCVFILICGNNPAVSERIAEFFDGKDGQTQEIQTVEQQSTAQTDSHETVVPETDAADKAVKAGRETSEENTVQGNGSAKTEQKSVDGRMYPYYGMLDDKEKKLYNQLYEKILAMETTFRPVVTVTSQQLKNAFFAVTNDHPELFWLDASYSYEYMADRTVISVDLIISRAAGDFHKLQQDFEQKADEIARMAGRLESDFEKELFVHDYLVDNIVYDETHYINQNAYSALIDGRTVCAGYARAFQYVMQKLEIPCYYVVGVADEDHAWNIVELDGGFYNVDVTWDDTEYGRYNYFNKTDAEFAKTHTRTGLSVNLPECNADKYADIAVDNMGLAVYDDMQSYYDACYDAIVENGTGTYEFRCILQGESLYETWSRECDEERYKESYMYAAIAAVYGQNCKIRMEVMMLGKERYLIIHKIEMS